MKLNWKNTYTLLVSFSFVSSSSAVTLTITDEMMVAADGAVHALGVTTVGNLAGPAGPSNGNPWRYGARERDNQAQTNRMVATFLQFDTSSLSSADVNNPAFTASFSIDYVGHLNNVNPGMDVGLGQITGGTWDDTGGNNPLYTWATGSSNVQTVVQNTNSQPNAINGITLDITGIVQDWVNNPATNQGLALFGYLEAGNGGILTNGGYFDNVVVETSTIPEPATGVLGLFGALALTLRRRRS